MMRFNSEAFLSFVRQFRRPYASMICATSLAAGTLYGVHTGHFIPTGLAGVLALVSIGDITARMAEKIMGVEA